MLNRDVEGRCKTSEVLAGNQALTKYVGVFGNLCLTKNISEHVAELLHVRFNFLEYSTV